MRINGKMNRTITEPSESRSSDNGEESDFLEISEHRFPQKRKLEVYDEESEADPEYIANISDDQMVTDEEEISFENASSDEQPEYKILNELSENDDGEWLCKGEFKELFFEGQPGFRVPLNGPDPYNFFEQMFDNDFFSTIVTATNKYAENRVICGKN